MKIKSEGKSGTRSVLICINCKEEFSELNTKIRAGKGKFCCNECYKEYRKKNKKDEKELNRLYQKKTKYNLTAEKYYNMFLIQNNKCAICHEEFLDGNKAFVDHCHKTNKVRGLLCAKCNSLLGMARDNIEILQNAIKYLQ
jgi:hypothetical protein